MMEVISDEITTVTQNTIPINVNFDSLLEKYEDQENFKLFYKHYFFIPLENGTHYLAYIIIFHEKSSDHWSMENGDPDLIGFTVVMEKEEMKNANMKVDFQLTINDGEISESDSISGTTLNTATTSTQGFLNCAGTSENFIDKETIENFSVVYGFKHYFDNQYNASNYREEDWGWDEWGNSINYHAGPRIGQLKSMKGKMVFRFETKPTFQKEFIQRLGLNLVAPDERENFTIICQDQKIKFDKQVLINISPVFREMLESPWTEESKNGRVEVKEVKPETLLAFKNLLVNGNDFKKEDLNIEIMIFADRYNITALLDLCGKYIASFAVNDENIFEFVQGLYLIKNGSFMNKATLLMRKNYEALNQDPRWKEFGKQHQECVFKMLELFAKK